MEEKRNQDITKALSGIVNALAGKFDMKDLLQHIVHTTMEILEAEVCSIFLKKRGADNRIECVAGSGFAEKIIGKAEYEISKDDGLTGYVAATGEPLNIRSINELLSHRYKKGKYDYLQYENGKIQCRNLLMLPLKIKNEVLGIIKVENKKNECGNFFSDENQTIFEIIANVISLTIKNTSLQEHREEQTEAIRNIVNKVVGKKNRKDLFDDILTITMATLKAHVCSIFLKEEDSHEAIECAAATGYAEALLSVPRLAGKPASYKIGEGFTGMVARGDNDGYNIRSIDEMNEMKRKGEIQWDKKYNDVQWKEGKEDFRNLLACPLKIKDETFGVIKVENKKEEYGKFFSNEDFQMFKTVANVVALTVENFNLLEQTKKSLENVTLMSSHKINNYLTNYSGIERQLRREGQTDDKILERLKKTTLSLKRLITELHSFAKPLQLKLEKNDINEVVNEVIKNLIDEAESTAESIRIDKKIDGRIPIFAFDSRLSESITELTRNAIRAITREKNSEKGHIIISTELVKEKEKINIYVEDDGPGLPTDGQDVFEPYFSTYPEGTGLGLATVKKMILLHGGEINILEKDKGACFQISLPVNQIGIL